MDGEKEKSFEKKQELIEAAVKEFGEKGYENASLNNILKQTGISKGTFYYHYKNKEDLYMALIGFLIEEKLTFFNQHVSPEDFKGDFFSLLKILTKTGLKFAKENPYINKFSESFLKDINSDIYQRILKKFDFKANDYYDKIIELAYARGEIREDLPKDFVKKIVMHLFTHIQDTANVTKIEDFEESANHLIEFMKNGLLKDQKKPTS